MMSEIKIKCPTCGKVLRLEDAPNINSAHFTCPVCKEKHLVGICQRLTEQPNPSSAYDETRYGSAFIKQQYSTDETALSRQGGCDQTKIESAQKQSVGVLTDNIGNSYHLQLGVNTVGRKAASSTASVQISTDDRTMSRSHAIIEVCNTGGRLIHILRNGANKNPSYLNDTLIGQQDQLILNNGDRIIMGGTELTFKK